MKKIVLLFTIALLAGHVAINAMEVSEKKKIKEAVKEAYTNLIKSLRNMTSDYVLSSQDKQLISKANVAVHKAKEFIDTNNAVALGMSADAEITKARNVVEDVHYKVMEMFSQLYSTKEKKELEKYSKMLGDESKKLELLGSMYQLCESFYVPSKKDACDMAYAIKSGLQDFVYEFKKEISNMIQYEKTQALGSSKSENQMKTIIKTAYANLETAFKNRAGNVKATIDAADSALVQVDEYVQYNNTALGVGRDAILDNNFVSLKNVHKTLVGMIEKGGAVQPDQAKQLEVSTDKAIAELSKTSFYAPSKTAVKGVLMVLAQCMRNIAVTMQRGK